MKITEYGTIRSTGNVNKPGSSSAAGNFSELLDVSEAQDTAASTPLQDVSATAALNNLLALQEISEEDVQRKKLTQQGKNLLDSLDNLRKQFLTGTVPLHTLQDIGRQINMHKQMVADPRLNEIIDEIELRAAVELAKLETAVKNRQD